MARSKRTIPKPPGATQPLQRGRYQALAKALRSRATELRLSVRMLAERLQTPRTTVHKTLSGQRRLDPIEFVEWCEALEIDDPMAFVSRHRRG